MATVATNNGYAGVVEVVLKSILQFLVDHGKERIDCSHFSWGNARGDSGHGYHFPIPVGRKDISLRLLAGDDQCGMGESKQRRGFYPLSGSLVITICEPLKGKADRGGGEILEFFYGRFRVKLTHKVNLGELFVVPARCSFRVKSNNRKAGCIFLEMGARYLKDFRPTLVDQKRFALTDFTK